MICEIIFRYFRSIEIYIYLHWYVRIVKTFPQLSWRSHSARSEVNQVNASIVCWHQQKKSLWINCSVRFGSIGHICFSSSLVWVINPEKIAVMQEYTHLSSGFHQYIAFSSHPWNIYWQRTLFSLWSYRSSSGEIKYLYMHGNDKS